MWWILKAPALRVHPGLFPHASWQVWGHILNQRLAIRVCIGLQQTKGSSLRASHCSRWRGAQKGGTLQISTLLAASSISSLRASALAPAGCELLDKPEDLDVCCHLMRKQEKKRRGVNRTWSLPSRNLDSSQIRHKYKLNFSTVWVFFSFSIFRLSTSKLMSLTSWSLCTYKIVKSTHPYLFRAPTPLPLMHEAPSFFPVQLHNFSVF